MHIRRVYGRYGNFDNRFWHERYLVSIHFSSPRKNLISKTHRKNACRMRRRNITCRKNNITSPPVPIVRDVRDSIFPRRLSRTCVIRRYICRRGCACVCGGWGVCRRGKVIPRETRKVV